MDQRSQSIIGPFSPGSCILLFLRLAGSFLPSLEAVPLSSARPHGSRPIREIRPITRKILSRTLAHARQVCWEESADTRARDPSREARITEENLAHRKSNAPGISVHFIVTQPKGSREGPRYQFETLFFAAIAAAKEEIRIVTPFYTDPQAADALMDKKRTDPHMDISVIFRGWKDRKMLVFIGWCLTQKLLQSGIPVLQWNPDPKATIYSQDAMIHWKAFSVDRNPAYAGSGNLTYHSFRTDYEAGYATQDKEAVAQINALMREDLRNSKPIRPLRIPFRPDLLYLFARILTAILPL